MKNWISLILALLSIQPLQATEESSSHLKKPLPDEMQLFEGGEDRNFVQPEKVIGLLSLTGHETVLDIHLNDQSAVSALEEQLPYGQIFNLQTSRHLLAFSVQQPVAAITCFHSFAFFSYPKKVLAQIEKTLQPGGKCLLVATPQESAELQILQAALQDTRSGRNNDLGKESWSIEDYRHNMKNLGFSIPHFEVKRSMKIYHSREELQNAARSWAERLSLHNLSAEFPDVFAEYAIQNYQDPSSGIVFIPSKTVLLLGVKTELSLIP